MKIKFIILFSILSLSAFSEVASQSMCEEGLKSFLKACEVGYLKCTASMPNNPSTCDDIYFECTQRANNWYNECVGTSTLLGLDAEL